MEEIISTSHKKAEPYKALLLKTDVEKVAQHLQISKKEVDRAHEKRKFEKVSPTPEGLMLEKISLVKKLDDLDNHNLLRFLSEKYQKTIRNYKVMTSLHPHKKDMYTRVKNSIFKEVQRAMNKDIRHRTTTYLLTLENTPERDMAIRSICRLFPKTDRS